MVTHSESADESESKNHCEEHRDAEHAPRVDHLQVTRVRHGVAYLKASKINLFTYDLCT